MNGIYGLDACRSASAPPEPSGAASIMPTPGMTAADLNLRAILRIVLVIVGVVLCLYVLYLLRKPIGWIVLATFIAVAMSAR